LDTSQEYFLHADKGNIPTAVARARAAQIYAEMLAIVCHQDFINYKKPQMVTNPKYFVILFYRFSFPFLFSFSFVCNLQSRRLLSISLDSMSPFTGLNFPMNIFIQFAIETSLNSIKTKQSNFIIPGRDR